MERPRFARSLLAVAVATLLIEAVTVFFRFGLALAASRDTRSWIAPFTFNLRIHHGYLGILLMAAAWLLFGLRSRLDAVFLMLGAAFFLSDVIRHFLVLWPITGDAELHFVYPR